VIHSGRKGPRQLLDREVENGPTMWNGQACGPRTGHD
jgi:hypothetical protein